MTFSVIVPVLYNFEGLAELFASISEPIVPVVVDNWRYNRGVAAGWNYGINKSLDLGIEQFVIMNDDAYFEENCYPSQLLKELDDTTAFVMGNSGFAYFATSKATIDRIGYFDENLYPAYFEDNDFAYRAKLAGLQYKGILHSRVIHSGSKTQNWNGERVVSHEAFDRNKAYYVAKWGGIPGEETFTTAFNGLPESQFLHLCNPKE